MINKRKLSVYGIAAIVAMFSIGYAVTLESEIRQVNAELDVAKEHYSKEREDHTNFVQNRNAIKRAKHRTDLHVDRMTKMIKLYRDVDDFATLDSPMVVAPPASPTSARFFIPDGDTQLRVRLEQRRLPTTRVFVFGRWEAKELAADEDLIDHREYTYSLPAGGYDLRLEQAGKSNAELVDPSSLRLCIDGSAEGFESVRQQIGWAIPARPAWMTYGHRSDHVVSFPNRVTSMSLPAFRKIGSPQDLGKLPLFNSHFDFWLSKEQSYKLIVSATLSWNGREVADEREAVKIEDQAPKADPRVVEMKYIGYGMFEVVRKPD